MLSPESLMYYYTNHYQEVRAATDQRFEEHSPR